MGSFLSKAKKFARKNKQDAQERKYVLPSRDVYTFTSNIHHDTYPGISPSQNPNTGRAVLVTGSNRGIGRAILLSYAKSGASHLALCSRTPCPDVAEELRAAAKQAGHAEPTVLSLILDVTNQAQIDAAAAELAEKWGRLDILINNAGYMPVDCFKPLTEASREEYERCWDVNFMGSVRVTRAFLPVLLRGGEKTVMHVVSVGALYTSGGGESYATTKFALCRSAEFLCTEFANEGLLAYAVHPAGVLTDLAKRLPKPFHSLLNDTADLAGDAVAFLTSTRRQWLAGRFINCNWDLPELMSMEKEIVEHDLLKFKCQGLV